MKKITSCLLLACIIAACKKEVSESVKPIETVPEVQSKKPPPPASANPVFAFRDNFTVGNRSIPGIFVMDVNGTNKTKIYSNYSGQNTQWPSCPAWSADGTRLCFTLNGADLYTLNITLVNGVPTGSNPTRIGDGVAAGGNYQQGKWRPGADQIACVWKKTGDPDKIHVLPSAGGAATVLYTTANTDWVIESDIAFKSDGSNLVFSERQISTGSVFLKVLDVTISLVIKSIDLSQYKSIDELDWGKSAGSNIVALTTIPRCDGTPIGINGIHQLFTVDVSSPSPSLTFIRNDVGNIAFSPADTQIAVSTGLGRACGASCCFSVYDGIGTFTFATQGFAIVSKTSVNNNFTDWKR